MGRQGFQEASMRSSCQTAKRFRRCVLAWCGLMTLPSLVMAQGRRPFRLDPPGRSPRLRLARAGTPLDDLLKELEANSPQLRAAKEAWDAAKLLPQASDPQLRDLARAQADAAQQNYEAVRRSLRADLKETYLQLSYVFDSLRTLDLDTELLARLEQATEARYRSGSGNQQDLLRAQLEQTKQLAEISHHDMEADKLQYHIKRLLNRSPSFSDVIPASSSETTLQQTYYDLFAVVRGENPAIAASRARGGGAAIARGRRRQEPRSRPQHAVPMAVDRSGDFASLLYSDPGAAAAYRQRRKGAAGKEQPPWPRRKWNCCAQRAISTACR